MKLFFLFFFVFTSTFSSLAQSVSFQTFMNPVIPGDHPDCTLSRVGDYFYTTGSSFSPTPKIYRSTDLVHWEVISNPVDNSWTRYGNNPTDGIWGGHIVFHGDKFWHFFGHAGTMFFVTATAAEGPWSAPVAMSTPSGVPGLGMDNSIFIDEDNRWFLLAKNGRENNWIIELGNDGQPHGEIYDLTWINPAPDYPFSWAEGPVMWKHNGFYYYSFARNLGGGQYVFRSDTLTDDQSEWENLGDLFEANTSSTLFPGPNHCSPAIILDDSTSWIFYHSYSTSEWQGQGRQGLLSQVRYVDDKPVVDFPVNSPMMAPNLPGSGIPWMVPKSDFFNSEILNPEWSRLGYARTFNYSLTDRPGWLRLIPTNTYNTVIKNDAEHNYSIITRMDFNPESENSEAGIRIMTGLQNMSVKLYASLNESGERIVCFVFDRTPAEEEYNFGSIIWLKLVRENHKISGFYSEDGVEWEQIGNTADVSSMDVQQPDFNAFTGNRQGLYVNADSADFDFYIYRDAYTPILGGFPANQSGTRKSGQSDLEDIDNNDWALYAGVEFGGNDYHKYPVSFEIEAASASGGGIAEIWLDSIDSGTKIGECTIENTGSRSSYKTFSAGVDSVSGRHDVYLRFIGEQDLFRIRSFKFTSKSYNPPTSVNDNYESIIDFDLKQNYPNPFNPDTKISYSIPENSYISLKVFNLLGQEVATIYEGQRQKGYYESVFSSGGLSSGIYFYRLKAEGYIASKKFVLLK